jgi:hypothetical protein
MENGNLLSKAWRRLKIKWVSISDRVLFWRMTKDNFSDDHGRCLTCNGTGKWYEGTFREETCVNCDGTGWRRSVKARTQNHSKV